MKRALGILGVVILTAGLALNSFAHAGNQKKALFIIAPKNFQEQEFSRPFAILNQNNVAITVASTTMPEAVGGKGSKARVDMLLKDARADDFDAIVFIGGPGAAQYIDDPTAHKLAQDAVKGRKVLAAICIAPRILGKAGVLKGKKATVFPSEGEKLKADGARYTGKAVERDGRIITADGPDSAQAFGQEIMKAL
jgi:protease I